MARMSATLTTQVDAGGLSQEIAEQLREVMIARGITMTELARRMGVSRPSVSALLDGSSLNTSSLERVAKAIGGVRFRFLIVEAE